MLRVINLNIKQWVLVDAKTKNNTCHRFPLKIYLIKVFLLKVIIIITYLQAEMISTFYTSVNVIIIVTFIQLIIKK